MTIDINTTGKETVALQQELTDGIVLSAENSEHPAEVEGEDQERESESKVPDDSGIGPVAAANRAPEQSTETGWDPYPRENDDCVYFCRSEKSEECCWLSCFVVALCLLIVILASAIIAKIFMLEYESTDASFLSMGSINKRTYETQYCTTWGTKNHRHCQQVTKCCKCIVSINYEYYVNGTRYVGTDEITRIGEHCEDDVNKMETELRSKETISISYDPDDPSMSSYEDGPIGGSRFAALLGGIGGGVTFLWLTCTVYCLCFCNQRRAGPCRGQRQKYDPHMAYM